jgi:hypothetical protein
VRERPREFLDSLSETALTSDKQAIYRSNGKRREVDLGDGLVAAFDEREGSALSSASGAPDTAGQPARMIGLALQRPAGSADLWYERGGDYRLWRIDGRVRLGQDWALTAGSRSLTSDIDDWTDLSSIALLRRDHTLGLRWHAPGSVWSNEFGLRRSQLAPEPVSALAPEGAANLLYWRSHWHDEQQPGLSLSAQLTGPVGGRSELADLDRPGLTLGASQRLGPASWWPGALLSWQEAMPAALLAQDDALTRNAVWRRTIGLELPYGPARAPAAAEGVSVAAGEAVAGQVSGLGTGGALYTQWRQHSLLDAADRQWVLGWRQGWPVAPDWSFETRIEQVVPVGGSSPKRSLQLGERLAYRKFPYRSYAIDATVVNADTNDSAYLSFSQTERLADDWLGLARLNVSRKQPHGLPQAGTSDAKLSFAAGWREPEARNLHILARYILAWREVDPDFHDPTSTDRVAHVVQGHLGYRAGPLSWVLRLGRRLDYDELYGPAVPRRTDMVLGRLIVNDAARVSWSAHVAQRIDSVDGKTFGYGAEAGLRLSRLVVLALGYNPRGFADNELSVDEKPRQGWTLRLRFSIEGAIGRWLDAGRSTPLGRRPAEPDLPDLAHVSGNAVEP